MGRVFIDSFVEGIYTVQSLSGKQGLDFEDSDQFGPSKIDRKGDPSLIPDKSWFWGFYQPWRDAGRPTNGEMSTPFGTLKFAVWADALATPSTNTEA